MSTDARVEWREWGPDAFETAAAEAAPVLLSLSASWCRPCAEMDAGTYADPRIAATINDQFVPVRVDVDRRPRVRDRYNVGGFPSTVFLTPDGTVLSGATYLDPDGMRSVLGRIRTRWNDAGADAGHVPRALRDDEPPAGTLGSAIVSQQYGALDAAFDERAGGWGDAPKFPHPGALEFTLGRDPEMARRCFDAVGANLLDEYDGGFYRFALERDWSDIQYEKRLDDNAALIRAFANAYLHTGEESYRSTAERAIEYLTTTLWVENPDEASTETGAFAASQAPVDADVHLRAPSERATADDPPVDRTIIAGANGLAIDALLTYAGYTDDERFARYASRALETVRTDLVHQGAVKHVLDETRSSASSCLLVDQVRVLGALTTARSVLGADTVADARTVADETIDRLREGDSFVDGPTEPVALLSRPLRPLEANAALADSLLELSVLTGEDTYRSVGRAALEAFAGASDRLGVGVATYADVAGRYIDDPLVIRVGTDVGSDLHRAALRMADHRKIVVPNAPAVPDGTALVERGSQWTDPAGEPAELASLVERVLD